MWKIEKGPSFVLLAEQLAVLPLPLPSQVQIQGSLLPTAEVVPAEHRLAQGAVAKIWLLALPTRSARQTLVVTCEAEVTGK